MDKQAEKDMHPETHIVFPPCADQVAFRRALAVRHLTIRQAAAMVGYSETTLSRLGKPDFHYTVNVIQDLVLGLELTPAEQIEIFHFLLSDLLAIIDQR